MPVGTSLGEYFDDSFHQSTAVVDPEKYNDNKEAGISIKPVPQSPTEPAGALPDFTDTRPHDIVERFATGLGNAALNAFALPGDVLSGKVQPGSIQEIERAADLAGFMVGGPAPVAAKMADGTLGSFAGVGSKTLNKTKLYEAQEMAMNAAHPDEIWQQTGFFKGADGRWRYEIPDVNSALKDTGFDKTILQSDPRAGGETSLLYSVKDSPKDFFGKVKESSAVRLPDVLNHPELYEAYPSLTKTKVQPLPQYLLDQHVKGQFDPKSNTIFLAPELHPEYLKGVLLHEAQHQIQGAEGFARGGSSDEFLHPNIEKAEEIYKNAIAKGGDPKSEALVKAKKIIDTVKSEAFENYNRLMGEVEARNVQARMNFNGVKRYYNPPRNTEDRPRFLQLGDEP